MVFEKKVRNSIIIVIHIVLSKMNIPISIAYFVILILV